ncbi:mandelate racemase/muconate lactonizing enzyme family protein [Halorubrum sp. AD140]|uniref:mandelate racemase/muconate lactonizing enzyme family protein n=1 Tax=Halorubrum sp. AD140 TaxID=3050073 RepID=UPI002ACCD001|nr:mandelate racemase/muconate lactonizing enzyme family protein [Halorubrum sp. AD140]MDZ5811404.1 mandelate racemase/muconate lactonizing enzyme family protein [Halorubrum sp. AD140]
MRITDVRGYALSSPIVPPQSRSFYGGHRRLLKRDVVLVTVETADGEIGFAPAGASSSAMREYFEGDSQTTFADLVEAEVANVLEGETLEDVEDAHELIDATGLPERVRHEATSAIDVALYDLRGKRAGAPICELLCAEYDTEPDDTLAMYASAGMYMEPEGYAKQAQIVDDLDFFGYKYRPGIGPQEDRRTIELLAETVDQTEVMIDAHTWWKLDDDVYNVSTREDIVTHAGEHDVFWVEEPVSPDDYEGYLNLADRGVALAGGESEPSPTGLVELAETGGIKFLQGDVRHHRGYTGCSKAITYCLGREVEFVPHNFGTWLGLIANAHLVAAAPEVRLLEYPIFENDPALNHPEDPGMYPFDLAFDIIQETIEVKNGTLSVPEGPGLGITVNLDVIDEYPPTDGAWTEFIYDE